MAKALLDEPRLVKNVLSASVRRLLLYQLAVMDQAGTLEGVELEDCVMLYGVQPLEAVLADLRLRIGQEVGIDLAPSYSFLWRYGRGAVVEQHTDRKASQIVATVQLASSDRKPWPFQVQAGDGLVSLEQESGDAIVIAGTHWPHWREECPSEWRLQLVLSFVPDRRGQRRFDGRAALGMPPLEEVKEMPTTSVTLGIDWADVLSDRHIGGAAAVTGCAAVQIT